LKVDLFISLHNKCNWQCKYCDNHKLDQTINQDNILKTFKNLQKFDLSNYKLNLEGGEIGETPKEVLDSIFNLDYSYNVSTNGLFLEKDYHNDYNNIDEIYYHCLPDFKSDSVFKKYNYNKLFYIIVITPSNIKYLKDFLELHNDIIFSPQLLQPRDTNTVLANTYFENVYSTVKNANISASFTKRLEQILNTPTKEIETKRKICAINNNNNLINIGDNKIHRCCISSFTDSTELNYNNLKKLFSKDRLFSNFEERCNFCYASYIFDKYIF